jgi:hypothetical protein
MSCLPTRSLDRNRYAAFVFAQSWHAIGMVSPIPFEKSPWQRAYVERA